MQEPPDERLKKKVAAMVDKTEMAAKVKRIAEALELHFDENPEIGISLSNVRPLDGGFRFSQTNEAFLISTQSPHYDTPVTLVVCAFEDGSVSVDFFSSESLSEIDRFENIGHMLYEGDDAEVVSTMADDVKDTLDLIDSYAASWSPA